jgi:hypothetical protein
MWRCPKCNENVENNLDVCWQCGTTRAGVEDETFRKESEIPLQDLDTVPALNPLKQGHEVEATGSIKKTVDAKEAKPLISYRVALIAIMCLIGTSFGGIGGMAVGVLVAFAAALWAQHRAPNDPSAGSVAIIVILTMPIGGIGGALVGFFAGLVWGTRRR